MKKTLLSLILILSIFLSCQEDENSHPECKTVNCTFNLISIGITITDQQGNPVALDTYRSRNLRTKKEYNLQDPYDDILVRKGGTYPVASDIHIEDFRFTGDFVEFVGKRHGKEVIRQLFVIGRGCCHVMLLEGEQEVTI